VVTGEEAAEGRRPSPATWDGFRDFVERPPVTPPEAGGVERGAEERLAYHSRFAVVRTPTIDAISRTVRTPMIPATRTPAPGHA
jgi:hypothetical protein